MSFFGTPCILLYIQLTFAFHTEKDFGITRDHVLALCFFLLLKDFDIFQLHIDTFLNVKLF